MKRFLLDDCKSRMIVKEKIREGGGRGEIYALFSTARARAPRRCALACNMCMRHGRSLVRVASRPTTAKPMVMVKAKVMVMGFFWGGKTTFPNAVRTPTAREPRRTMATCFSHTQHRASQASTIKAP
jgi:hypothetical protein